MPSGYCPDCDEEIVMNSPVGLGQKLACPHCGADLKVMGVDPPQLDWVYDWSYEENENEDDR